MDHIDIAIDEIGNREDLINQYSGEHLQKYIFSVGIDFPKCPGVYGIRNAITNKLYIGSSKNISRRIKKHVWELTKSIHRNKHLQNSFNLQNGYYFYPFVFELCDEECLAEREQAYLDFYKTYENQNGYNSQRYAYSNKGTKLSEETKRKISMFFKGKPKSQEHNRLNSITKTGYRNPNYGKPISDILRNIIIEKNIKTRKKYKFINPQGKIVEFIGLAYFCKQNNLSAASMSMVYSGKQRHHKQWKKAE